MAVTLKQIATALGQTEPDGGSAQADQWAMWIGDATLLIKAEAARRGVEYGTLDPETVDYVTREAVVAHVRRPDDATSVEIAVDDGREARRYSSGRGRVSILPEWWGLLFPEAKDEGKAFAVDSVPCIPVTHSAVCSANDYANAPYWQAFCTCGADAAGAPIYGSA